MKDYVAMAAQYQADVLSGAIPACKWVRLACERNRRDIGRQDTEGFPYRFDPAAASKICAFAELLPHIKGPEAKAIGYDDEDQPIWNKLRLEPWQVWFFTTLFGWVCVGSGLRRFRVSLTLIPRKNGKSTLGAIVVLYMLCASGEGGPECYSVAKTRDQAKAVAEIAWQMAKRSPQLCEYYGVRVGSETTMSLSVPKTAGKFLALSSDANSLDGLNVFLAVIDELHAHPTAGVWNVMDTGTGARLEPLLFAITTAGVDLGGICHQKLGYLEKVLDGVAVDETFFGINYTTDVGDDERDVAVQRKANPNFGVSVQPDDLARKINEAQHSRAALDNVLTKHFNVWIRAASSWMPMAELNRCGNPRLRIEDMVGVPCWIGVDLAEVQDIAAAVAIFRPDENRYVVFGRYYLPEQTIQRSPIAQVSGWVRDGHLISIPGNQIDYLRIENDILDWYERFDVREIDFDRALAQYMGQSLKRRLEPDMGKDAAEEFVLTVDQTLKVMNPAMQLVERLVLSGNFQHDANPVLLWAASNIVTVVNEIGEVYPRKAGGKDSPNKIDPWMAIFTAISRASLARLGPRKKSRGARVWTPEGWKSLVPKAVGVAGGEHAPL